MKVKKKISMNLNLRTKSLNTHFSFNLIYRNSFLKTKSLNSKINNMINLVRNNILL